MSLQVMNQRQQRIQDILNKNLSPLYLLVENESSFHSVPKDSETHFKVLVVSASFEGLNRLSRQRLINELLAEEFNSGLHALTQRLLSHAEWQTQQATLSFESPACVGASKSKTK